MRSKSLWPPPWWCAVFLFLYLGVGPPIWASDLEGRITSMELTRIGGIGKSIIQLVPLQLPFELPKINDEKWKFEVSMQSSDNEIYVLFGSDVFQPKDGKVIVSLPLQHGVNKHRLAVVDLYGKTIEYEARILVENTKKEEKNLTDVSSVLIVGPLIYHHSISRTGAGVTDVPSSGFEVGVRGIYRHRLLKAITDRMQKNSKIFADLSAAIGKSVAGDSGIDGIPKWADARLTFEILQGSGFRFELGTGMSYFAAGLQKPVAGDIQNYFGFVLSGRAGYHFKTPISFIALGGLNYGFPSTQVTSETIFTSHPVEVFLSLSFPRGMNGSWEFRLRLYELVADGLFEKVGSQTRTQTYLGPEFFWIKRF